MKAETKHNFANRGFLTFKNLTLVPYQRRMIDPKMLNADDVAYLVSDDNNVQTPRAILWLFVGLNGLIRIFCQRIF